MKIVAIRGKNIASLEGEFEVDFTKEPLKSAGIFAITGHTGSGKSTLLDTLCLALFDNIPRNNRTSDSLTILDVKDKSISQTDSRTVLRRGTSNGYAEVEFVSLGGETFVSRWSVRRSRDKVDGSLQSVDFRLTNLSTNSEVPGRKTELLAKIVELIGLTFDQFTRAVLLAQGDFATFLKATQKEKAELLEKLTGTEIYSRISSSIYEKSKNAEQDLNLVKEQIKGIELLSDEACQTLIAEKQAIKMELDSLKIEVERLTAKIKWINDEALLMNQVNQAEQQLQQAQRVIEEAKPRVDFLHKSDSVQAIRDSYVGLKSTQQQLVNHQSELAGYKSERDTYTAKLKQAKENLATSEADQKNHLEAVSALEPLIQKARSLDIQVENARKRKEEAEKERLQAIEAKRTIEKSLLSAQTEIETAEKTRSKCQLWFDEHQQYSDIVPRMELIDNLLRDVQCAKEQKGVNEQTLAKAEEVLVSDIATLATLTAEAERLNNLLPTEIAMLRAKLTEGAPCPVCGSVHHPMTEMPEESVKEAELNQLKEEVRNKITLLQERIEKRKAEIVRLQSMVESYANQAKEADTKLATYLNVLPDWQQCDYKVLQRELKEIAENWKRYSAEQTTANEQYGNFSIRCKHENERLLEANEMLSIKETKQRSTMDEFDALQKERAQLLDGKSADLIEKEYRLKGNEMAERVKALATAKEEIAAKGEKLAGSIAQLTAAIETLTKQSEALQTAIHDWLAKQEDAMSGEQLALLLSKDTNWLAAERKALDRLRDTMTSIQATLTERKNNLALHDKAEIKPEEGEEMEALQMLSNEKNNLIKQNTNRNVEIEMLFVNHDKGKSRIKAFEKELEAKGALSENWKKLNEMFGSADGAKFKVLAQGYTLDVLLSYANKHLNELSKRYVLQRIPDTLGLQVVDLDMLGEIRTVHSLSGGESFLISLALALGLSSLSSNRMNVESLFIDEGFGSLDLDTLRVAMDALERLQTQGRKIGVISHVAEMTERITAQVRVVKTSNGKSKIEISGS